MSTMGTSPRGGTPHGPRTPRTEYVLPSTEFTFTFTPSPGSRPASASSRTGSATAEFEVIESPFSLSRSGDNTPSMIRNLAALSIDPRQGSREPTEAHRGGYRLSPNRTVSTYGGLYNATPSPGPSSPAGIRRGSAVDTAAPLSPGVRSVALDLSALTVRNSDKGPDGADEDGSYSEADEEADDNSATDSEYNVRQEELPRAPFYDARLQYILRKVRGELMKLSDAMTRSELARNENTRLYELKNLVQTESRFECPETRTVGFIGNSGVGKSSVINSLLDMDGLARSNGDGSACTSVVTEFRNVDDRHQPYTIEVDYMTREEITTLLEEALRSYRRYRVYDNPDIIISAAEQEQIRVSSETAFETFRSLFPDRFRSEADAEFLSSTEPDAETTILTRLRDWAIVVWANRPGGPDASHHSMTASTSTECKRNIGIFTMDSPNLERAAIWPFVKLIRVYLNSPVLRTGLVLADLPGFRDMNFARVQATERYLRHTCDEVFIVHTIDRCSTDMSVNETMNRVRHLKVRLVCTRSEDVNPDETPENSPMFREIEELLRRRRELAREARRVSSRRQRSSGALRSNLAVAEADLNDEKNSVEYRLKELSMKRRNATVTNDISTRFADRQIKVFCVSNKLYADHRMESGPHAGEYIRLSGIPELRRYCQSVPAEAQLQATSAFLENRVPALLGSINLWTLAGSDAVTVERAEALRRALNEAQDTIRLRIVSRNSCIRLARVNLDTQFRTSIIHTIRDSRERWTAQAVRTCEGWATLYHSTYAAFCRKGGVHQPRDGRARCWNEEILEGPFNQLSQGWATILQVLNRQQDSVETQISETFESVRALLFEHSHLAPQALESLIDNMESQERCIMDVVETTFSDLTTRTEQTKLDTIYGHDTSYIADAMRPAYNACCAISGRGSDAQRKRIMNQHIRQSNIFQIFSNKIQADYTRILDESFDQLKENLREEIQNTLRDLGTAIATEDEVTEAGQFPALADEVRGLTAQVQEVLGVAQRVIRELEQRQTDHR